MNGKLKAEYIVPQAWAGLVKCVKPAGKVFEQDCATSRIPFEQLRVLKNLIWIDFDEYMTGSEYIFYRMWVLNARPRKVHLILWAAIVILSCLKLILKSLDGLWSLQFEIGIFYLHLLLLTDKRTDVWSRDFIIWKFNSGLWAVVWAGMWNKRVWADYEQLLRPVFFWVKKLFVGTRHLFSYLCTCCCCSAAALCQTQWT